MQYMVLKTIRAKTEKGDIEIQPGKFIRLPMDRAIELIKESKIKAQNVFDPDNLLVELFQWGEDNAKSDKDVLEMIDSFISKGALRKPWGYKVKDSPKLGSYWVISDEKARKHIAPWAMSFTIEELRPIIDTFRVFPDAELVEIDRTNRVSVSNE